MSKTKKAQFSIILNPNLVKEFTAKKAAAEKRAGFPISMSSFLNKLIEVGLKAVK